MANIFDLAYIQLEREGLQSKPNELFNLINRAYIIRKWLDLQIRNQKVADNRVI